MQALEHVKTQWGVMVWWSYKQLTTGPSGKVMNFNYNSICSICIILFFVYTHCSPNVKKCSEMISGLESKKGRKINKCLQWFSLIQMFFPVLRIFLKVLLVDLKIYKKTCESCDSWTLSSQEFQLKRGNVYVRLKWITDNMHSRWLVAYTVSIWERKKKKKR